ncbi:MAG: hypothetical protein QGH27_03080 [SAR324 cluster bacterium]|jgi:hypothetical protein|nr:hypothetical protein [SAR324 cluster bacterium]|tara:strand:+ start:818 stop:1159 length:342 start_codon:yes stop_codon:yes gene_type:complete
MVVKTNIKGLPESIVSAITYFTSLYSRGDAHISMTQLLDSPKIRILRDEHKDQITEDVSDDIWKVFGNAVHLLFQQSEKKKDNVILEKRFFGECNGWKVSGAIDRIEIVESDD